MVCGAPQLERQPDEMPGVVVKDAAECPPSVQVGGITTPQDNPLVQITQPQAAPERAQDDRVLDLPGGHRVEVPCRPLARACPEETKS